MYNLEAPVYFSNYLEYINDKFLINTIPSMCMFICFTETTQTEMSGKIFCEGMIFYPIVLVF